MKTGSAIEVHNLSKRYFVGGDTHQESWQATVARNLTSPLQRLGAVLRGRSAFAAESELWALRDVSFEVREGEIVGLIGANGSGKSTLLKILSRITYPTTGSAWIRGAVGSLLEVGTGFHQELTGRENIYMNGAVLGVDKARITHLFDEIVAFSGIGDFLDTPVKRYSSGMRVRLAFSVAVHLQPEIVLIDEVLSVGDAGFRKASLDKIARLASDGRTVILVSHNLQSVQQLCTRALYLNQGHLVLDGEVEPVIERYLSDHLMTSPTEGSADLTLAERDSGIVLTDDIRFTRCALVDAQGKEIPAFRFGDPLRFKIEADSRIQADELSIAIRIYERHGTMVTSADSKAANIFWSVQPGETLQVIVALDGIRLVPGTYSVALSIRQVISMPLDFLRNALSFSILDTRYNEHVSFGRVGLVVPSVQWDGKTRDETDLVSPPQSTAR